MLDRLKSLPLTILLTILIWMYAEAQFTATKDGLSFVIHITPPSGEYVVRIYDKTDQLRTALPVTLTIQGPQSTVSRINDALRGQGPPIDELAHLAYDLNAAQLNTDSLDTLTVMNSLPFFKSRGVVVTAADPPVLRIQVERMLQSLAVKAVPVYVNAPPALLAQYDIEVRPRGVDLELTGSPAALQALALGMRSSPSTGPAIRPTLDLTSADAAAKPDSTFVRRALRYELPDGTQLKDGPKDAEFRLLPRAAPTQTSPASP